MKAKYDPFGSMQGFTTQFNQFRQNPGQYLISRKLNIPENLLAEPQKSVQYLLNNGTMTQQQLNQIQPIAQRLAIALGLK